MKAAVIGYGNVGMATFNALLHMPEIHELVLCGRNKEKIEGELSDFKDSLAINTGIMTRIGGGGYEMTKDADIIIYTAGPSIKNPKDDRMSIVKENVEVAREVCYELNKYNRDAFMIVISNPVDVLVSAIINFTGRPRNKVIGTGTLLDTTRLRRYLAEMLDIQPKDVTAFVLGEHGSTSFIVWDRTRVMGMKINAFLSSQLGKNVKLSRLKLEGVTRRAGFHIVEMKGSTSVGVAAAAAQIVAAIIHDTHEILPISVSLEGEYGIDGIALSVPCYVCATGAYVISGIKHSDEEHEALMASAEHIRRNSEGLFESKFIDWVKSVWKISGTETGDSY